jgi:membrane protein
LKKIGALIKGTFLKYREHDPVIYAAAIAFLTLFSLPSVLIIIIQIGSPILGEQDTRIELSDKVESLVGTTSTEQIQEIIDERAVGHSEPLTDLVSVVFLLLSATVIFSFLKKALNAIWGVKPKPKQGWLKFITDGLRSLLLIFLLSLLLLVTLSFQVVLNYINEFTTENLIGVADYINETADYLVSWGVASLTFALLFKYLPDAHVRWREAAVGALVTGVLFTVGKYLIGVLLMNTSLTTIYGAAGSLAGLLVWVFYTSILLLIGAMFTHVYAAQMGESIKPKDDSVRVVTREVAVNPEGDE